MVYAIGALDLKAIFGNWMGDTQFKKVCVIAAVAMMFAQSVTAWATQERVLVSDGYGFTPCNSIKHLTLRRKDNDKDRTVMGLFSKTFMAVFNVPERIQAICYIQFWSWIGWFPVLFYASTWIGEIYLRYEAPDTGHEDALDEVGRRGSMSLIVFSSVTTFFSIVLPWFIQSPGESEKPAYTARPPSSLEPILSRFKIRKPSLLSAWAVGNLLFTASMIWAPVVRSVWFATLLFALLGIPSAIGALAPATFLGVEVNRMSSSIPLSHSRGPSAGRRSDSFELDGASSPPRTLHLRHESTSSVGSSSTGELSGIYLGILNIYTTLPQFVGTAISWVVFSILEPGKSPELAKDVKPDEHHASDGLSGIAVCLFSKFGPCKMIITDFANTVTQLAL
jgi:solute carrier family 45, member 1/2/4